MSSVDNSTYFHTSPETGKIDAAMVKVQAELKAAPRDSKNPHFKSFYSDINSMIEASRPTLAKHGVTISQWPVPTNTPGFVGLVTRIACQGEYYQSTFAIPVERQNAQGYGSAITYARRYSYGAAIGLATTEDDDGNASQTTYQDSVFYSHVNDHMREHMVHEVKKIKPNLSHQQIIEGLLRHDGKRISEIKRALKGS